MNFFIQLIKSLLQKLGVEISKYEADLYSDFSTSGKALNFKERFKESISDPINLMIERVPEAGYLDQDQNIILHNGNKVPRTGRFAYYGNFSDLLIFNRGVHEPLEEFCFQEVLKSIGSSSPSMVELGSYWSHYSMWLLKHFPQACCTMVEPDLTNLKCGQYNFFLNNYCGDFIHQKVCSGEFEIDLFMKQNELDHLTILHSDIQGFELEMLECSKNSLASNKIDFIFLSTHSQDLHQQACKVLRSHNYRVEVSSVFDTHH